MENNDKVDLLIGDYQEDVPFPGGCHLVAGDITYSHAKTIMTTVKDTQLNTQGLDFYFVSLKSGEIQAYYRDVINPKEGKAVFYEDITEEDIELLEGME